MVGRNQQDMRSIRMRHIQSFAASQWTSTNLTTIARIVRAADQKPMSATRLSSDTLISHHRVSNPSGVRG